MFARLVCHAETLIQRARLRASTGFLLARRDDRLLDDIGLTRAALEEMHLGLDRDRLQARVLAFPPGGALPVFRRA